MTPHEAVGYLFGGLIVLLVSSLVGWLCAEWGRRS